MLSDVWVWIAVAIPLGIYAWIFIFQCHERRGDADLKKKAPESITSLYKRGKRSFLCIHCGQPLKTEGRFECRAGHAPPSDRSIFKHCYKCNDVFELIFCHNCQQTTSLVDRIYNEDEIIHRGKKYISRKSPLKLHFLSILGWSLLGPLCYFALIFGVNFSYSLFEHRPFHATRILMNFFVFAIPTILATIPSILFIFTRKEVVIKNPYE